MADALEIIRRRFRHPYQGARLDALGEEAHLRTDLLLFELDLLTIQTDIDELAGFETPDGIYHKWERVADVVAAVEEYAGEATCPAA
ncbi:hypothetical protein C7W88_16960 [Novosphingobium sp. THN1]|uniref:hypothetical protein n=1 Tax=Novosphingobium sp. THN1 TaxID=1016987 RepID=UPI000E54E3F2|nr:hypothetical protein [Novosphingobium sp. THN1]AXU20370.1 hypothetical protein C7W88_16960 [Novosphingobium sp. THN1]